jgi:hypothetical protein
MNKITGLNFFLGFFLAGRPIVTDDVNLATGQHADADPIRRVSLNSTPASATEAASAATVSTNQFLAASSTNALPSLPPGVSELRFSEFFRRPIGPRGLECTERLRSLEGRRIRILGYMVRQEQPVDHGFLLSPVPLTLHESEYGLADDLPVTALHVFTAKDLPVRVPYTPGPLLLTGKLSLGNRRETDGRTSVVRLHLDPPTPEQKQAAEQAVATLEKKKSSTGHHNPSGHSHDH